MAKLRSNYRVAGDDAYTMQHLRPSRPTPRHPTVELEVLPITRRYHPAFCRPVLRAIRQPPTMMYSLVTFWRNALPSLPAYINHHNRESCVNDDRVGSSAWAGWSLLFLQSLNSEAHRSGGEILPSLNMPRVLERTLCCLFHSIFVHTHFGPSNVLSAPVV